MNIDDLIKIWPIIVGLIVGTLAVLGAMFVTRLEFSKLSERVVALESSQQTVSDAAREKKHDQYLHALEKAVRIKHARGDES